MFRFILIAVCVLLVCCSKPQHTDVNLDIAKKMFDAFNRHQWDEMAGYYHEQAKFLDPSFGKEEVIKSRTETAAKYREMQQMFPDIHDNVVKMYPSNDHVTVEFVSTGKMNDSISFSLPIITVLTFHDGLIIRDATYYDVENP